MMSSQCLLGKGHFNNCPEDSCACICHEIDGEITESERIDKRCEVTYYYGYINSLNKKKAG